MVGEREKDLRRGRTARPSSARLREHACVVCGFRAPKYGREWSVRKDQEWGKTDLGKEMQANMYSMSFKGYLKVLNTLSRTTMISLDAAMRTAARLRTLGEQCY